MPITENDAPGRRDSQLTAQADVCHVARRGNDVVILFGQREASTVIPGGQGVRAGHRITLGASGAARMQDLLTTLLQELPAKAAPRE